MRENRLLALPALLPLRFLPNSKLFLPGFIFPFLPSKMSAELGMASALGASSLTTSMTDKTATMTAILESMI